MNQYRLQTELNTHGNIVGRRGLEFSGGFAQYIQERSVISIYSSLTRHAFGGFCNSDELWISFARGNLPCERPSFVRVQNTTPEPFVSLWRCGRSTCRFTDPRRKYFKQRISYYPNSCAGFNFMKLCISLSGDIHPLPGPDTTSSRIAVIHGNRQTRRIPDSVGHVSANCNRIQLTKNAQSTVHKNQNKLLEIAHLNAELLKCRQHFTETKELALERDFDILTISESWFNSSVIFRDTRSLDLIALEKQVPVYVLT